MQDGPRKAHQLGESRIAMQRIAVARQGIEQRLVRPGVAFLDQVGGAFGNGMQRGSAVRESRQSRHRRARRSDETMVNSLSPLAASRTTRSCTSTAPLPSPLSRMAEHALVGHHFAFGRQRLVEGDAALAIHHHGEIDGGFLRHALAFGRRFATVDHAGKGGHHFEPVILIDEGQFLFVQRIAPEADAQGIEHHVLFVIARGKAGGAGLHHVVIIYGHGNLASSSGLNLKPVLV